MSAAADALMGIFGFKRVEGEGMKTDRELLELAARADGVSFFVDSRGRCMQMHGGLMPAPWNPLTDDGDALRLAVDLSFDLNINPGRIEVFSGDLDDCVSEPVIDGNVRSATRRAIVRAAAAIGEAME